MSEPKIVPGNSGYRISGWYDVIDPRFPNETIWLNNNLVMRDTTSPSCYYISYLLPCTIPDCECNGQDLLPTIVYVRKSANQ